MQTTSLRGSVERVAELMWTALRSLRRLLCSMLDTFPLDRLAVLKLICGVVRSQVTIGSI